MYHANLRQGSSRTKSRAMVEGSTKKIYKQKGTGRARHGDRRPPQFKGGGHTFAKRRLREHYHLEMPKKMRRAANRNALLAKLIDNEVRVVDSISFEKPKTTAFIAFLKALNVDKTAYVALANDPARASFARLSARNVEGVTLGRADTMNAFNMLGSRYLVIERGELEAWLAGPWSQTGKDAKINPMGRENAGAVAASEKGAA
jgi:large subunit ribosomal protein L4